MKTEKRKTLKGLWWWYTIFLLSFAMLGYAGGMIVKKELLKNSQPSEDNKRVLVDSLLLPERSDNDNVKILTLVPWMQKM